MKVPPSLSARVFCFGANFLRSRLVPHCMKPEPAAAGGFLSDDSLLVVEAVTVRELSLQDSVADASAPPNQECC